MILVWDSRGCEININFGSTLKFIKNSLIFFLLLIKLEMKGLELKVRKKQSALFTIKK